MALPMVWTSHRSRGRLYVLLILSATDVWQDSFAVSNMQSGSALQVLYKYADGIRWAVQMTAGLAHIHAARPLIIHRDLKLDNVLLTGAEVSQLRGHVSSAV